MNSQIRLVIAMPVYNEAEKIAATIAGLETAFLELGITPTYVIQDDDSKDDSLEALRELERHYSGRLVIEQNARNRGHGPTVMRAYSRALSLSSDAVVHIDSDGEIDPRAVARCGRQILESDVEAVIGARSDRDSPLYRRAVTSLLRVATTVFFGVRSLDVNSPVRAYQHATLSKLVNFIPPDSVTPHVLMTVLTHKKLKRFVYLPAESSVSSSGAEEGSTWRSSNRLFGIPTRFLKLVWSACKELARFRLALARQR
jgi:dolichol-phosphate mannosyltransferase